MDPAVSPRCVRGGRGEGVGAVGRVGEVGIRGGEGVGEVGGFEGMGGRWGGGACGGEWGAGEEADGFKEGGLEGPAVGVSVEAVGGEDLAEDEEGGHCSVGLVEVRVCLGVFGLVGEGSALVFEDYVVAAEGPAVVAGVEVVAEGEDAPG